MGLVKFPRKENLESSTKSGNLNIYVSLWIYSLIIIMVYLQFSPELTFITTDAVDDPRDVSKMLSKFKFHLL